MLRAGLVDQREAAADDGVADLADGHRPAMRVGQRSRSSWSSPTNSSTVVVQSSRSIPAHRVRVCV